MSVVFEVKTIKPKKMNLAGMRDQILMALNYEGQDVQAEYEKTTESWTNRPKFEIITDITGNEASVLVGTDDKVFGYVDEGTRAHIIRPRRARALRFQVGYRAKTKPGHIGSFAGGKYGAVAHARYVKHPGTKARKFTQTIQKRRKDKFTKRMVQAMQLGSQELW